MRTVLVVVVVTALCVVVLASAACHDPANDQVDFTPPPEPDSSYTGPDTIAWSEASSVEGQRMIVEGPVVSVDRLGGGAVALNIGLDAPSAARFVAVVPAAIVRTLPAPAADMYEGTLIHVTGVVTDYEGSAAIKVKRADALKIQR